MEVVDPVLPALRARLERLGYVVVPHGDHLCVRLSLFASVRVYDREGRLELHPRFGPFSRSGGLLATSVVSTGAVAASALAGGWVPFTVLVAFVGVVGLAHDACRFVITEGALTRLQLLVAGGGREAALRSPVRGQPALDPAAGEALPAPSPERAPARPDTPPGLRPPSRRTLP